MSGNDVVPSEGGVLAEFGSGLKSIPGAVKAIARLVGGAADVGNSWLDVLKALGEQKASAIRSDTASALAISKAITKEAVKHASADEALAERAVATFMSDAMRKQENREGVAKAAVDDLHGDPPPSDTAGPSEDWMSRFQRYAEDVSSEEVRLMWGRVLAAEIRRPGLVSARVLRAIDEIDAETAELFNSVARAICGKFIIQSMSGSINFDKISMLVEYGLVVSDSGFGGHLANFKRIKQNGGDEIWLLPLGEIYGIGFSCDVNLSNLKRQNVILDKNRELKPITMGKDNPRTDVYALTDTGLSISNIIFSHQYDNILEFARAVRAEIGEGVVLVYKKSPEGSFGVVDRIGG